MRKYTTQSQQVFWASSHTAAHRHLCTLLRVEGPRQISCFHQGVEVHASNYDGEDFIRDASGRVRKDWPASTGTVRLHSTAHTFSA
jgi:hypothetical protein